MLKTVVSSSSPNIETIINPNLHKTKDYQESAEVCVHAACRQQAGNATVEAAMVNSSGDNSVCAGHFLVILCH